MFSGSPGAYLRQVMVEWMYSQWFWTSFMAFTSVWWIGWFGIGFTAVVHFVDVLTEILSPRYRKRRVVRPPDKARRLSGKKWRKLRKAIAKYQSEVFEVEAQVRGSEGVG